MVKSNLKTILTLTVIALLGIGTFSCQKEEPKEPDKPVQEPDLGIKGFDEKGASYAYFSVAPDKIVFFSRGNLQYQASTNTWRFAEHQYDFIGADNANISSSNKGWIDLFGWGSSGWKDGGAVCYQPYSSSTDNEDYLVGYKGQNDLNGSFGDGDWAYHNAISNGGNKAHLWRTLTRDEWNYLFYQRKEALSKFAPATVGGVHGIVILPDVLLDTTSLPFNSDEYEKGGWEKNVYTKAQWLRMEKTGAIFLPAAGKRYGKTVLDCGTHGNYWSVNRNGYLAARYLQFTTNYPAPRETDRCFGLSVRPVIP